MLVITSECEHYNEDIVIIHLHRNYIRGTLAYVSKHSLIIMQIVQKLCLLVTNNHVNQINFKSDLYHGNTLPRVNARDCQRSYINIYLYSFFREFMIVLLGVVTSTAYIRTGNKNDLNNVTVTNNNLRVSCF